MTGRHLVPPQGRRAAKAVLGRRIAARRQHPDRLRELVGDYRVGSLVTDGDGRVPLRWWVKADNFGDLLSRWLIGRMTGREVVFANPRKPHYVAIGSILNRTNANSLVWGAGSFGTEDGARFGPEAKYFAVRGPLSRARLLALGIPCPEVYGDPALLVPAYFAPRVEKTHKYGIVARWSERRWDRSEFGPDVKLIDLGTDDIEGTIEAMLSCRRIVTGSLHGLVLADAYGLPSAWISSPSAWGGAYKFFDYFSTVDKLRNSQRLNTAGLLTASRLRKELVFDARPISFDYRRLLDACPFLERAGTAVEPLRQQADSGAGRADGGPVARAAQDVSGPAPVVKP
jgi:pyruvyltransferase